MRVCSPKLFLLSRQVRDLSPDEHATLPRSTWQESYAPSPSGGDLDGYELVGGGPEGLLSKPASKAPARPVSIHCRPALAKELRRIADILGARLVVTDDLPMAEAAAESMLEHLMPEPVTVPHQPKLWQPLIQQMHRLQPWAHIPDSLCFRFPSGCAALQGAVAILLGMAGEQVGLAVYPTEQAYENFLDMVHSPGGIASGPWTAWAIHLDPLRELSVAQRKACADNGLTVANMGLLLRLFDGDRPRVLTKAEEEACRVALVGVLGAYEKHGTGLLTAPRQTEVSVGKTTLTVTSAPFGDEDWDEVEDLIIDADHQIAIGLVDDKASIVVKMGAREARRLVDALAGVDAVSLDGSDFDEEIRVWAGDRCIGVLTRGGFGPSVLSQWRRRGEGLLVVSAGGARRRAFHPRDFLDRIPVKLRGGGQSQDDLGMFNRDDVATGSWAGPPETWPKASTVLLDYAQALGAGMVPVEVVEPIITIACTVWNAVVMADQGGDGKVLAQLRAQSASDRFLGPMIEELIVRKRKRYAQDHRLMMIESCTKRTGQVDVRVAWRMP